MRWRKVLAVTGSLMLGAVFGPPLFGAASTLFWVEATDGQTATRVAWRVYDRIYPLPVGLAFMSNDERLPDVSLGASCHQQYRERLESADQGTYELWDAIRRSSNQRLHGLLKSGPAYDALLSLPRPVLGAVDACLGGSPMIWPFCQAYARGITDKAQAQKAKSKEQILDFVRRQNEVVWCAAASADQLMSAQARKP